MRYLTAADLKRILDEYYPDDARIAIRAKTPSGASLYYDLQLGNLTNKLTGENQLYLYSEGLDLTIAADIEMLKEDEEIW